MRSPANEHLPCFQLRATIAKAIRNIPVQVFFWTRTSYFLGKYLGAELLGHRRVVHTTLYKTLNSSSKCHATRPPARHETFSRSTALPQ